MKIAYFPTPLPDETFHSLIARYHLHTFTKDARKGPFSFLARDSGLIPVHLPTGLSRFVKTIKHVSDLDENSILSDHTIWPFLKKFISHEDTCKIEDLIKVDVAVPPSFGNFALVNIPKYCPICNSENFYISGELYWMRVHQVPGINICMKHNCFLESYDLKSKTRPGIFIPNFETCPIEKPRINRKKILTEVAKFMQTILYDQTIAFKLKYPSLLADHGYYSWYQAYYPELKEDIFRFYGETVIKNYWLPKPDELVPGRRFYEDRPIQNPVKHVLLQYFLKNNKRKDPLREELKALEEKHERDRTKMKELTDLYNETKSFDVLMQIDQVFRSYGV